MTVLLFRGAAPKNPEWVVEFLSVLKPPWLFRYLETGLGQCRLSKYALYKFAAWQTWDGHTADNQMNVSFNMPVRSFTLSV